MPAALSLRIQSFCVVGFFVFVIIFSIFPPQCSCVGVCMWYTISKWDDPFTCYPVWFFCWICWAPYSLSYRVCTLELGPLRFELRAKFVSFLLTDVSFCWGFCCCYLLIDYIYICINMYHDVCFLFVVQFSHINISERTPPRVFFVRSKSRAVWSVVGFCRCNSCVHICRVCCCMHTHKPLDWGWMKTDLYGFYMALRVFAQYLMEK